MDDRERRAIEDGIRAEARSIALALADYPEFAIDVRDLLDDVVGHVTTREELDDLHAIGSADDVQADPDSADFRRYRRLGELKLALDDVRGSRWPTSQGG